MLLIKSFINKERKVIDNTYIPAKNCKIVQKDADEAKASLKLVVNMMKTLHVIQ